MRILPILFNTDMVRAILDGRKAVTRRCVKFLNGKNPNWTGYVKDGLMLYNGTNEPCIKPCQYQPGDTLYVRETWCDDRQFTHDDTPGQYFYRVDSMYPKNGDNVFLNVKWHPSIHMPKEAARIWLKVKDVRVERLQEIDNRGCCAEGIEVSSLEPYFYELYKARFKKLWNSTINKSELDRYGWDANPWVWVIEFERCEKPEDF